ncbi:MAG: hypothetical protein ACOVMT_06340 [Caulobacter sp.]
MNHHLPRVVTTHEPGHLPVYGIFFSETLVDEVATALRYHLEALEGDGYPFENDFRTLVQLVEGVAE